MHAKHFMNISTLVNKLAMVWRARKVWRKPKSAKILIYDRCGSDILFEYIKEDNVEILDVRGESINIYVLLRCVFPLVLSGGSYANKYISIVRPSVIITFIDNNPRFYELKWVHPKSVMIFIQNGGRGETADVFGLLKTNPRNNNYQVDYMLTFGAAIGAKYLEYINGRIIPIGSMKANRCKIEKSVNEKSLVFISQFASPPGNSEQSHFVSTGTRHIAWNDFYSAERKVVKFLANYCEKTNLVLQVCGRNPDLSGEEYEFFRESIGSKKWEFIPRDGLWGSYKTIDRAEFVIGIDSTLVYESLARGNKTGVFSVRSDLLNDPAAKFGWPEKSPDNGPFWTNYADENEFERVLYYLTSVSNIDWEKTRQQYVTNLIEYDPGNTRFIALLQKLNVQLNGRYTSHAQ